MWVNPKLTALWNIMLLFFHRRSTVVTNYTSLGTFAHMAFGVITPTTEDPRQPRYYIEHVYMQALKIWILVEEKQWKCWCSFQFLSLSSDNLGGSERKARGEFEVCNWLWISTHGLATYLDCYSGLKNWNDQMSKIGKISLLCIRGISYALRMDC